MSEDVGNGSRIYFLHKPQTRKNSLDCQTVDPPRHALLLQCLHLHSLGIYHLDPSAWLHLLNNFLHWPISSHESTLMFTWMRTAAAGVSPSLSAEDRIYCRWGRSIAVCLHRFRRDLFSPAHLEKKDKVPTKPSGTLTNVTKPDGTVRITPNYRKFFHTSATLSGSYTVQNSCEGDLTSQTWQVTV